MSQLMLLTRRLYLLETNDGVLKPASGDVKEIIKLSKVVLFNEDSTPHYPNIRELRKRGYRTVPGLTQGNIWYDAYIITTKGLIQVKGGKADL